MSDHVKAIASRLSLRPPQRESLETLARVCGLIPLKKQADAVEALEILKREFPTVTDFERDFPSLCFALATGVGKTRLMGAFIAWLYEARGIRHFFVLAPNLTIYNKLFVDVRSKTDAAVAWCRYATGHETTHGGKPWSYLLIPDDAIQDNATRQGLAAAFVVVA